MGCLIGGYRLVSVSISSGALRFFGGLAIFLITSSSLGDFIKPVSDDCSTLSSDIARCVLVGGGGVGIGVVELDCVVLILRLDAGRLLDGVDFGSGSSMSFSGVSVPSCLVSLPEIMHSTSV